MSQETQMTVQTIVLIIIGLISGSMIPWAYIIERRLASLEAKLNNGFRDRLDRHSDTINKNESSLQELKTKVATLPPEVWRQRIVDNEKGVSHLNDAVTRVLKRLDKE